MAPNSHAIADAIGASHDGPCVSLSGAAPLADADASQLTFCDHEDRSYVESTEAGAVICRPCVGPVLGQTQLFMGQPRLGYALAVDRFFLDGRRREETAVHDAAVVAEGATLGERTYVGPNAHVAEAVAMGDDCVIRAGAVVGCAGGGVERDGDGVPQSLPHDGGVTIGDDVTVGANATVDRGVADDTTVGDRVTLGANAHVAAGVAVGDDAVLAAGAVVTGDVDAGTTLAGSPARQIDEGEATPPLDASQP